MKKKLLAAAFVALLAGCADHPIPFSTTDPPAPNAAVDDHCMQDCLGDNSDVAFCHDRCAK